MSCTPTVYRVTNQSELFSLAVSAAFEAISEAPAGPIVVALPGGRSIQPFLTRMTTESSSLPKSFWSRLQIFLVDERAVPTTHDDSNFRLIREHLQPLISKGLLGENQFHPLPFQPNATDFGAADYTAKLSEYGGKFHLAMLGVGEDAHVGALFPAHHSITNSAEHYFSLTDSPKPPPNRVTSSRALLARSHMLAALVVGEPKRQALELLLDAGGEISRCPARVIYEVSSAYVFSDLS